MKYIIEPQKPKIKPQQEITEVEYNEITNTRKLAWDILLVKEFFSYAIRNFYELESEIQKIESEMSQVDYLQYRSFALNNNHIINLRIMNLLTTCKSYLELFNYETQRNQKREIFQDNNSIRDDLKSIINKYHDRDIIYKFFGYFRNYAQHHSRPISGIPSSFKNQEIELSIKFKKIVESLKNQEKSQNKQEKVQALIPEVEKYIRENLQNCSQEILEKYPEKLKIRRLINEYIGLIKNIHEESKEKLNSKLQEAKKILHQKVEDYCQNSSPDSAFKIFKENEETQESEESFDVSLKVINDWEKTIEEYTYTSGTGSITVTSTEPIAY